MLREKLLESSEVYDVSNMFVQATFKTLWKGVIRMRLLSRLLALLLVFSLVLQTACAEKQIVAVLKSYETEKSFSVKNDAVVTRHSSGHLGDLMISGDGLKLL